MWWGVIAIPSLAWVSRASQDNAHFHAGFRVQALAPAWVGPSSLEHLRGALQLPQDIEHSPAAFKVQALAPAWVGRASLEHHQTSLNVPGCVPGCLWGALGALVVAPWGVPRCPFASLGNPRELLGPAQFTVSLVWALGLPGMSLGCPWASLGSPGES